MLSGCDFSSDRKVKVGVRVIRSAYPKMIRWADWPNRELPSAALEHQCFLLNIYGPDLESSVSGSDFTGDWDVSCLQLDSVSEMVTAAQLMDNGISVDVLAGSDRTIELLGINNLEKTCDAVTKSDWFSPVPADFNVLGTATQPIFTDSSIPITNTYDATAPAERLAPCAPLPTVSAIAPTSGLDAGGGTVTISGSGFLSRPEVKLGASTCEDVVVTSSSQLTCTVPPGTADTVVDVSVKNRQSTTRVLSSAFSYIGSSIANWRFIEKAVPDDVGIFTSPIENTLHSFLVEVQGELWVVWDESQVGNRTIFAQRNAGNNTTPNWVDEVGGTTPAGNNTLHDLVSLNGKLYVGLIGDPGVAKVAYPNAGNDGWVVTPVSTGVPSANRSRLAVFESESPSRLYMAYSNEDIADGSERKIFLAVKNDGVDIWNPVSGALTALDKTDGQGATDVDIIYHNSNLSVAWTENLAGNNQLYVTQYDGSAFVNIVGDVGDSHNVASNENALRPRLASHGGDLYVVWREDPGAGDPITLYVKNLSRNTRLPNVVTPDANLGTAQIASYGGRLYLTWESALNVYVSYWDGSAWNTTQGGAPIKIADTVEAAFPSLYPTMTDLYLVFSLQNQGVLNNVRVAVGESNR